MYTPCKPQFYYIKVGFKGIKLIWACFRDVDNEGSDQTARMCWLISVFVGRTYKKVPFLTLRLISYKDQITCQRDFTKLRFDLFMRLD